MHKTFADLLQAEIDPVFSKRAGLIFQQVEKLKPREVLDVGCGRGFYTNNIARLPFVKQVIGLEVKEENLTLARKNQPNKKVEYLTQDFYNWQTTKKFDLIILSEVLEHLVDDELALKKLKKLLKKNGRLIVTVPHSNYPFLWDPLNFLLEKIAKTHVNKNIWWLAGIWADHEQLYTIKQIKDLVQKTGFKIDAAEKLVRFCWPFSHFLIYGIGKNLVLRLGMQSFNRFESSGQNRLSNLIARIFSWPDRFGLKIFSKQKEKDDYRSAGLWFFLSNT
jgi:2-polyprenyl-6-hydroxyphenyl methylase / 3-demethylubiquinone-9 3-methyltransferase